ncbi:MAG TPA: alpha/beta hydrolase [Rhizobiaceae bacterium]|nr:alpha/beta hydrolase [Rhizobiaceae bacterium]
MAIIDLDRATRGPVAVDARKPILALHAAASSGEQWRGLSDYLRGRYRVIAPDLPGYGSARLLQSRSPRETAGQLAQAIADDGPLHVVGHSLGAAIGLELAASHPHLVRSLTLIEPMLFHLLRGGDASDRALHAELVRLADRMLMSVAANDNAVGMQAYIDFWYGAGAWRRTGDSLKQSLARLTSRVASDLTASLAATGGASAYRELRCPALLVTGLRSPVASLRASEMAAEAIPHARLMMIADAGHMAPLTDPHIIDPLIGRHLSSVETFGSSRPFLYRAA